MDHRGVGSSPLNEAFLIPCLLVLETYQPVDLNQRQEGTRIFFSCLILSMWYNINIDYEWGMFVVELSPQFSCLIRHRRWCIHITSQVHDLVRLMKLTPQEEQTQDFQVT